MRLVSCCVSILCSHADPCRLLNQEGSLMAFAGKSDKKENITAAIAANIWMSNERGARVALPDEKLQFIVLDCLVSSSWSSLGRSKCQQVFVAWIPWVVVVLQYLEVSHNWVGFVLV